MMLYPKMKGIVAFRNSENAMRRWSLTRTQRAMAVTELRTLAGRNSSMSFLRIMDNSEMEIH